MPALFPSYLQRRGLVADVLSGAGTLVSDINSSHAAAVLGPQRSLAGPTQTPAPTPPPVTAPPLATPATGPGAAPPATPIAVSGAATPLAHSPLPALTQDNDDHTKDGNHPSKGTDTSSKNPSSTASVSVTSNSENSGNGATGTATVSSTPTSSAVDGTTTDTADAASPSFSSTAGAVSPFSSSTSGAVYPASSSTSGTDSASSSSTPDFVASSSTVSSIVFPSVSALNNSPSAQPIKGQDNTQLKTKHQSHAGEIAGGVVGGLIFLLLLGAGVLWFLRRQHRHTAPSAEFLTVFPPATPFRQQSFRVAATKQYGIVGGAGAPPLPFSVDMEKHPGVSTPSVSTMTDKSTFATRYP